MTSLSELFDVYSLRARIYPALLVLLPATTSAYLLMDVNTISHLWPVFISAGGVFFLAALVRGRGLRAEQRLIQEWNGMPTTHALRFRSSYNAVLRDRYRERLERACGVTLPSREDEEADPDEADTRYVAATRILITRVRDDSAKFPRVQEENINYGFRRNLYAMKPQAILVALSVLLASFGEWHAHGLSQRVIITCCLSAVVLLTWVTVVTPAWVFQIGERYAERLFETLEDPSVTSS